MIALLTTAGEGKRKISFYYDHYEADGKRHHGRLPSGEDRLLSVSPLLIIASDDRYALLAEKDEGGIEVYFLDLMSDVKLLEDPASDTLTQAQIQALKRRITCILRMKFSAGSRSSARSKQTGIS